MVLKAPRCAGADAGRRVSGGGCMGTTYGFEESAVGVGAQDCDQLRSALHIRLFGGRESEGAYHKARFLTGLNSW